MPYNKLTELPESVRNVLPKHAQEIYQAAFNNAWKYYADANKRDDKNDTREEVSHKVAWNAVKEKYHQGKDGNWHKK
ncbi:ChaB family protein [Facilibium subflavum]|uniref:ChaB family protein n=1 Tax=Facilibium subflavum TaxID=2219058 RepID=UPI000E648C0C|nr:ChaB family protein [Facilibium subflavum]